MSRQWNQIKTVGRLVHRLVLPQEAAARRVEAKRRISDILPAERFCPARSAVAMHKNGKLRGKLNLCVLVVVGAVFDQKPLVITKGFNRSMTGTQDKGRQRKKTKSEPMDWRTPPAGRTTKLTERPKIQKPPLR